MASILALLVSAPARADDPETSVAVIALSDVDRGVVDVVESLGVKLVRRDLGSQTGTAQVLVSARDLPDTIVLWVDSQTSSISVLRTADGTSLSRQIARRTFSESPYVAALAATELIELMRNTPPTQVEAPKPSIDEVGPALDQPVWGSVAWVGAELAAGPRRGPALFRPVLGVDALYRFSEALFADLGVVAMPVGATVQPLPRGDEGRVTYRRSDLALRLGIGTQRGDSSFVAHLSPGMGFLSAEARGIDDERARTKRRTQWVLGGGLAFRTFVWARVGMTFALDVTWLTTPARYLADGALVLREDSLRVGASFGLLVRLR